MRKMVRAKRKENFNVFIISSKQCMLKSFVEELNKYIRFISSVNVALP